MIHRFLPSLPSFPSLSRLLFIFPASILLLALMPALCAVPAPDNKPLEDWTLHRPASTPADAIGIRETDTTTGAPVFILRRTAAGTTVAHLWWGHTRATRPGETWHLRYEARARPLASSDDGGGGGGGDDGEYNAYVNVTWQGMDRQWLGAQPLHTIARHSVRWPNASRPAVPDWKTFDVTFTPPATATALGIRLAIDNTGASEAAFRNITLRKVGCTVEETLACLPEKIPVYRIPARPVTANGVTLTPDWTLDGAPVTRSATRFKVPLNALWAIQPSPPPLTHTAATASSSAAASMIPPPRDDDWAFFKVPGYFNRRLYSVYGQDKTTWAARNLYSDPVGLWYVRDVQIPALDAPSSADGILHFEVGGMWGYSVRAYWDGQPLGNITDQLGGRLPLPPTVRPGDRGQLALYALRVPPERRDAWRPDYIRAHNPDATFAGDQSKGFHDLYLTLQPRAARIDGIKLSPTVRPPDIALGLHLASPVPALSPAPASAQPVRYHLAIRDAGGRTVLARELGPGAPDQDGITWQIPWQTPDASPRLWTPDDPYLHTAIIQARSAAASDAGRLLDESLPIPFGLREVYVDGRELRFNGHPFRIRPRITLLQFADNASIRRQISFLKDMGFNCLIRAQAGGGHNLEEEARTSPDAFFSIADELGMMLIPYLPYSLVNGGQFAGDSLSSASGLQSLVHYTGVRQITRFYNHPSIIAWSGFGHSPTRGINPLAIDPAIWGITPLHRPGALDPWIPDPAARADVLRRLDSSRLFVEAIKKLDPSRPFLSHNDSGQGDGWGFFDYLNWTPLQEWEDWPRQWSQKGVMPIGSTEHGLPYPGSFVNHAPAGGDNEPWITEYAAVEQGPAAYERESSSVLDYITRVYDPVVKNYSRDTRNPPHDSGKAAVERAFANVQPVWAARNQAIYRAWRTYGVPMGIEPFGPCNYFLRDEALFKDEGAIIASPDTNLKTTGAKADRWTPRGYWPSETMLDYPEHPAGRPPPARYFKPLGDALVSANSPLLAWIAGGGGGGGGGVHRKVPRIPDWRHHPQTNRARMGWFPRARSGNRLERHARGKARHRP
ncbi:MAG: hypothetical protein LBK99_12345 [Opitutaceae bacterium]|jgi:hypothetical protein|nr:hypothetical protein [Opitutaceae bacterium]